MIDKHLPAVLPLPYLPPPFSQNNMHHLCNTIQVYTCMFLTYGQIQMFLALKPSSSQGKSFVKILYSKNWMYTYLYSMYVWFIKCRLLLIFRVLHSVEVACLAGYLRFVGSILRSASNKLLCIIVHVYICKC